MTEAPDPAVPEKQAQEWSIMGGIFDPEDPSHAPQLARLERIWEPYRNYSLSAKTRFGSLGILAYAIDLCGIDLSTNPSVGRGRDYSLAEDFSEINGLAKENPLPIQRLSPEQLPPVLKVVDSIIAIDPYVNGNRAVMNDIRDFCAAMVKLRHEKEIQATAQS